ncbi:MAG TPA: hypothetical protein VHX86_03245 [Tepidisphaeraceae bacterium]|jgi:hypothetical protein|nr:hypothetical protein [Tepidisphaeraceae bacterium]
MNLTFERFLPHRGNDLLRDDLGKHYQGVYAYFRNALGYSLKIDHVDETKNGENPMWFISGNSTWMRILYDQNDKGNLFHEVTHDLFHFSVFHGQHNQSNTTFHGEKDKPDHNEAWGEPLCEAMRWLMETAYVGNSNWLREFCSRGEGGDWSIAQAIRLLDFTGWSLDSFTGGWNKLVAGYDETGDFLNRSIPRQ